MVPHENFPFMKDIVHQTVFEIVYFWKVETKTIRVQSGGGYIWRLQKMNIAAAGSIYIYWYYDYPSLYICCSWSLIIIVTLRSRRLEHIEPYQFDYNTWLLFILTYSRSQRQRIWRDRERRRTSSDYRFSLFYFFFSILIEINYFRFLVVNFLILTTSGTCLFPLLYTPNLWVVSCNIESLVK